MVLTSAAQRQIGSLPAKVAPAVVELIFGPLAENPKRLGKPLRFELEGQWSARRGDFRVIYRVDETRGEVAVLAIDHRSKVFRPRHTD